MNKNINSNITDIALTAYKSLQNGKDINNIVKSSTIGLGINILKNKVTGQRKKITNTEKVLFFGGLLFLGLNYKGNKQTLNY